MSRVKFEQKKIRTYLKISKILKIVILFCSFCFLTNFLSADETDEIIKKFQSRFEKYQKEFEQILKTEQPKCQWIPVNIRVPWNAEKFGFYYFYEKRPAEGDGVGELMLEITLPIGIQTNFDDPRNILSNSGPNYVLKHTPEHAEWIKTWGIPYGGEVILFECVPPFGNYSFKVTYSGNVGGISTTTACFWVYSANWKTWEWKSGPKLLSYGDVWDIGTFTLYDDIPPAKVEDLSVSAISEHAITLTWTVPGDNEWFGPAKSYDIRYRTDHAIGTETDFTTAVQVEGEPSPITPSDRQSFVVGNLQCGQIYYFALKTNDWAGNVSLLSNSASGLTLPPSLNVPILYQDQGGWEGDVYDHLTGAKNKIKNKGCAITSVCMVLLFHGINIGANNLPVNPGNLNNWLKNNEGYSKRKGEKGNVKWEVIPMYSNKKVEWVGHGKTSFSLDSDLSNQFPVIIGIDKGGTADPDHFVVAKGKCQHSTIPINDPVSKNKVLLKEYSVTKENLDTKTSARRYKKSSTDFSWLSVRTDASLNLLLIDQFGRKTGIENSVIYEEIPPSSFYFSETISDDETGEEGEAEGIINAKLPAGVYKIVLQGTSFEKNTDVEISGIDKSAETTFTKIIDIFVSPTLTQEININYSPEPGAVVSVKKVVTFTSLKESVNVARRINQIDNDGIENSLIRKLKNAEEVKNKGQIEAAKNILNAFINEVEAQSGKHITKESADILVSDAKILIGNLN